MTVERYALENSTGRNYYTALYHTAMTISSSIELDQVLENIVEGITKAMGVRATNLFLRDQESGRLRIGATYGPGIEYLQLALLDAPSSLEDALKCSEEGNIMHILPQDGQSHSGLRPALWAALKVHDEPIGVICVYTDGPAMFQDEDQKFLTILASLAAQAIENARLYHDIRSSFDGMVNAFLGI
jgi:GAF domain-containing protein